MKLTIATMASTLNPGAKGSENTGKAHKFEQEIRSNLQQPGIILAPKAGGRNAKGDHDVPSNEFPARFIAKDDYDNTYALKNEQLAQNTNLYGVQPQVHMQITDKDLAYAERKREQSNYLLYRQWQKSCINMSDPAQGNKKGSKNRGATKAIKKGKKTPKKPRPKK